VRCVWADLLEWEPDRPYELWHDRAVLHFLVEQEDRERYFATMQKAVTPGGYLILGVFAADGPEVCSGLSVQRYSAADLTAALGEAFQAIATRREVHVTPSGALQPFTWIAGSIA
jgi:trans-aconitate methyltransferase